MSPTARCCPSCCTGAGYWVPDLLRIRVSFGPAWESQLMKQRRFGFVDWNRAVVCLVDEITNLRFEPKGSNDETKSSARLVVGTVSQEYPTFTIGSFFGAERLAEIY